MFDYFMSPPEEIPEEYLWQAYDWQYFTWIGALVILGILLVRWFCRSGQEKQGRILKGFAVLILIQEIVKDILHYAAGTLEWEHLPLHLCGISIFFTLWYAFRPNKLNGAYIYGLSIPGAMCALLFPNWMQYPVLHFSAINSFTIHAWLIIFGLMALLSGRLKPDIRQVPKLAALLLALAFPIYFLNKALGTNFMFINTPSPGSPLIPLYDIFGNGYAAAAFVLLVLVQVILFLPWEIARRRHNK